ncbi:universal stress protein [Mesorhizobium soli]|uniref:Universal stress protein n=1 Tax=Pseudaminobacter soli (ex Li et al. 2025) TaxID=1295366 RepID=A0A2P7S2L3_9HYPH|nr:universal stress protein [Mesorhizobium soli]
MTCMLAGISAQADFEGTSALRYATALAARDGFELSLYVFAPAVDSPAQLSSTAALDWEERETARSEELSRSTLQAARELIAGAGVGLFADYASSPGHGPVPFLHAARVHDLTVLDAAGPDNAPARNAIESALFDSGRPLLIVPAQGALQPPRRILIAWDGSARSGRAVKEAMPFLTLADKVTALTVTGEKDLSQMTPGAGLKTYLARHGIGCELAALSGKAGDAADLIRRFAASEAMDMLVMGAFVHSWLREAILGGVTRSFLGDCPLPLLMAH